MSSIKNVILLGPQASGKSTQASVISGFLHNEILTSSSLLREEIAKGSDMGKKIEELINEGSLIPDGFMISLVLAELKNPKYIEGFLLDGFPRNIEQARSLDEKHKVHLVVNIELRDEVAVTRMVGRRVCPNGHTFNLISNPPKEENVCDECKEGLFQRDDDKEEAIRKRLEIYRSETAQLVDYYNEQKKLLRINGEQDIEMVSNDILSYLKAHAG